MLLPKNGESHKYKMIYMTKHYWKLRYNVLCFLTPETYPNYPLSHHPSSFPLTEKQKKTKITLQQHIPHVFCNASSSMQTEFSQTSQFLKRIPLSPFPPNI